MNTAPPPRNFLQQKLLPVLEKLKGTYIVWNGYHQKLPKTHRYTLGNRVDMLFIEIIEAAAQAVFISRTEKEPWVRLAIRKLDALKLLAMILWESKSLDTKKYAVLSEKLDEVGRMLGGWSGQLRKQNSPAGAGEK